MTAHTPAPWHTDGVVVWASDDGGQSFDVPVCVMTSRHENPLTTPAPNAPTCGLDNADLVAAAPDLLLVLKRAVGLLDCWGVVAPPDCPEGDPCPACRVTADAEQAILKAEPTAGQEGKRG